MKKKSLLVVASVLLSLSISVPALAASDPYLSVYASFGSSSTASTSIRGEATAGSIADSVTHVNLSSQIYKKGTQTILAQGIVKSNNGLPAEWSSYQLRSGSYTLNAAARTYYADGTSSDQKYSSANWN